MSIFPSHNIIALKSAHSYDVGFDEQLAKSDKKGGLNIFGPLSITNHNSVFPNVLSMQDFKWKLMIKKRLMRFHVYALLV